MVSFLTKEMFSTKQGMIEWNKKIFDNNRDSIELRVNTLLENKYDSTIRANIKGIKELNWTFTKKRKIEYNTCSN